MYSWIMKNHGRFRGRQVYTAHQQNPEGGIALLPPVRFNAAIRFIRKYAHFDINKVLSGEQTLPKDL